MKRLSIHLKRMIEGLIQKDEHQFNLFYHQYYGFVFFVILKIVKNRLNAEELAQDVFVKVYESIHTFHGHSFENWLYTIAYNHAINYYHREMKREKQVIKDITYINHVKDTEMSVLPLYSKLLQHFKEIECDMIIYHIVFDFSFDKIALMLSMNKTEVFRTYKQLKIKLSLVLEDLL
jgi:RNA polymerase sigma-70 factor, ECF subfamily